MYRFLLLVLNALAVGFLVYRLIKIQSQFATSIKKKAVLASGILLLLLPVTMIIGFIRPSPIYLAVYPLGIFFFVYLFRLED